MGESKDTTVTTTPVNFVGKPGVDDGAGCHAGKDALMDAARSAGKSDTLDQ